MPFLARKEFVGAATPTAFDPRARWVIEYAWSGVIIGKVQLHRGQFRLAKRRLRHLHPRFFRRRSVKASWCWKMKRWSCYHVSQFVLKLKGRWRPTDYSLRWSRYSDSGDSLQGVLKLSRISGLRLERHSVSQRHWKRAATSLLRLLHQNLVIERMEHIECMHPYGKYVTS